MPTLNTPLGKTLDLGLKTEVAYGVVPSAPLIKTPVYSIAMRRRKPLENDPILGATQLNTRDATAPAPGLITNGGSIVAPLDFNHSGYWLHLFFGDAVVTGTTVKTHEFSSGRVVLPSKTIQQSLGARLSQDVGVVGRTLRFQLGQEAGYRRITMEVGAQDQLLPQSAPLTVSPAVADARFAAAKGQLLLNGSVVANLLSFDATYDTKLTEERFVDGKDVVSNFAPDDAEATFTGTMTVRWLDDAYEAMARAENDVAMTVRYAQSASLSLDLTSTVRLESAGVTVEGPGKLQQQVPFRGQQTSALPMLRATLVNAIAAYV